MGLLVFAAWLGDWGIEDAPPLSHKCARTHTLVALLLFHCSRVRRLSETYASRSTYAERIGTARYVWPRLIGSRTQLSRAGWRWSILVNSRARSRAHTPDFNGMTPQTLVYLRLRGGRVLRMIAKLCADFLCVCIGKWVCIRMKKTAA